MLFLAWRRALHAIVCSSWKAGLFDPHHFGAVVLLVLLDALLISFVAITPRRLRRVAAGCGAHLPAVPRLAGEAADAKAEIDREDPFGRIVDVALSKDPHS